MRKFKVSLLVMVVLGTLFGTGCNDMHNVFHERAGIVVANIEPQVLMPKAVSGTGENTVWSFPSSVITFSNLNAIPATIKRFSIEYYNMANGQKFTALSLSGTTFIRVEGVATDGGTGTTATGESTAAATTSSAASGGPGQSTINPWSDQVIRAMYNKWDDPNDNLMIEARIHYYGEDSNANTFMVESAVTLMP